MDACDVLFSKPGGLTSTEAAVKGVPLIHTAPIPGCENRNAAFFARRGMSYYCQEPAQQAKYAKLLCENQFLRFRMAEAQRRNTNACPPTNPVSKKRWASPRVGKLLNDAPGYPVTCCWHWLQLVKIPVVLPFRTA